MIKINKDKFVNHFLAPINKLAEQCSIVLDGQSGKATTTISDINKVMFLHCETNIEYAGNPCKLNIGNVSKLQKAIQCIDEDEAEFALNHNNIQYSSPAIKFVYHLLEDNIISQQSINVSQLQGLKIDTSFNIPKSALDTVLRNSAFTSDSNKLYIYTKDDAVRCELNDKTMPNLDSIDMKICDSYSGESIKTPIPLRLDWIRCFISSGFDAINVTINDEKKIIIFNIKTSDTSLKYIVSGLTK